VRCGGWKLDGEDKPRGRCEQGLIGTMEYEIPLASLSKKGGQGDLHSSRDLS
jgi:hypothetical protein